MQHLTGHPAKGEAAMQPLNSIQRHLIASSLEIDGRPDTAATTIAPGNITEFRYRTNGAPATTAAVKLAGTTAAITNTIALLGLEATIKALREPAK